MKMKTLSVRPPWSWLIVKGYKPVENRDRKTNIRGEILIHQAKTFDWHAMIFLSEKFPKIFIEVVKEFQLSPTKPWYISQDKLGGIVGKTEIIDCVSEYPSPWFFGPEGYVFKNSQELPFMKIPGMPGFFEVEYSIESSRRINPIPSPELLKSWRDENV